VIADLMDRLVEAAWGQYSNGEVAKLTHRLVDAMSNSVNNLWIVEGSEAVLQQAITNDEAYFSYGKGESAYTYVQKDGKWRVVLNKNKMGEMHEAHVQKILERAGFEILESKLRGNQGIDLLAIKRDEKGEIEKLWVLECEATGKPKTNYPSLSDTKKGKQLESTWIAEKMIQMYNKGGELRENAILMRQNLDKLKSFIAFEKEGINSWKHQDRVPDFDPVVIEEILQKENWEGW